MSTQWPLTWLLSLSNCSKTFAHLAQAGAQMSSVMPLISGGYLLDCLLSTLCRYLATTGSVAEVSGYLLRPVAHGPTYTTAALPISARSV